MSKDDDALSLFRAAVPLEVIKERVGFKTITSAQAAVRRALEKATKDRERIDPTQAELDRVDALYRAAYPKAIKGDTKAVETCLRLSAERYRLLNSAGTPTGLSAAYQETIDSLSLPTVDASAVATGRAIAQQIDEALEFGSPLEKTKALYLVPHLMNVLKELGATPAAREQMNMQITAERDETPIERIMRERAQRGA